ncbi:MAG: hypothetical protein HYY37_01840 [Candidatus Aenigmarchaeota archaeon]|nr:hypothetical protein [Candidatus Aenigmarchaeota archaeon]
MGNRHIKVINGRRYYYESIRRGKKVTSRYLGPVDARIKKERRKKEDQKEAQADAIPPEDSYIG